jgi:hypothetical protein
MLTPTPATGNPRKPQRPFVESLMFLAFVLGEFATAVRGRKPGLALR